MSSTSDSVAAEATVSGGTHYQNDQIAARPLSMHSAVSSTLEPAAAAADVSRHHDDVADQPRYSRPNSSCFHLL